MRHLREMTRTGVLALGLTAALAGGALTVQAQGGPNKNAGANHEKHPVLANSMRQLEAVRDRLQKAPTDFGGHREKAVDAISHAINELQQAIQYDNR
jgi:hypothetical protein